MANYIESKKHKNLSFCFRNHQVELKSNFKVKDDDDVPASQIILCLDTISKKTKSDVANVKKQHGFWRKIYL